MAPCRLGVARTGRGSVPVPLALVVLALLLTACSGGDGRVHQWRGLDITLPEGWHVFEQSDAHFSIADAEAGTEPGDAGDREVAAFFTHEPRTTPDDWRDFLAQQDAEIETDESFTLDGNVPATRFVYSFTTNDVPTREMVVLIPSRSVVVLLAPTPEQGETDAPEVFLDHLDEFELILDQLDFGAPVDS